MPWPDKERDREDAGVKSTRPTKPKFSVRVECESITEWAKFVLIMRGGELDEQQVRKMIAALEGGSSDLTEAETEAESDQV